MTIGNVLFTGEQRRLLTAALNRIIPSEGEMPGAGDLGLENAIEQAVAKQPGQRRLFIDGLAQLAIASAKQGSAPFHALSDAAKDAVLREVESQFSPFFELLVRQCYNAYYTSPEVFDAIGYSLPDSATYQPRPFDESLLEPQRQRAPFWRQV